MSEILTRVAAVYGTVSGHTWYGTKTDNVIAKDIFDAINQQSGVDRLIRNRG